MLEVEALCAGYSGKPVLRNISLTAQAGAVTAIVGPNGCGKSTLLKALCGILPAQNGRVLLDGMDVLALHPRMAARKIAYLAQNRQTPDLTAQQLVLHGRFPHLGYPRRYRKADYACVQAAMEQMGVWEFRDTPLACLSGGQRQQVYIAMALAQDTPVVLLDEPTTFLDIAHQLQMLRLARDLARQGKTVLMVIHDLPHGFQMADQMVVMNEGTVVARGTPEEVYGTGKADEVFRVRLKRAPIDGLWRYYCEEEII